MPPLASASAGIAGASTVTHARPPAIVIACGLPPTTIVATTFPVRGSIRVTVPSPLSATHTEPAPTATPAGSSPTRIVAVTARVSGSIRTIVSSPLSATHTPPSPIAIALGPLPSGITFSSPVGSMRVTVSAVLSVTQTAPAPTPIPAGAAFGSTWSTTRAVSGFTRETSPEYGATQRAAPRAAMAPGLPGTTLPTRTASSITSNRGSMRLTVTKFALGLEPTTHIHPSAAAIPVGGAARVIWPSVSSVPGSTRETVWSSTFAIHSEPDPNAIAPGRAPTGTAATTRLVWMSMAATELGATRTATTEPPVSSTTPAAIAAASRSPPATA